MGDIIRNEFALVDVFLGFHAEFGAAADVLAEDGAGFDMIQTVFVLGQSA